MDKKLPITLIVLTYNEELHLSRCLENAEGRVHEMIVVDSDSTDRTADIAKEHGAKVYVHKFENQAKQFNWALDNVPVSGEWVLRLDADEYILPELWEEIEKVLPEAPQEVGGYYMKRRLYFMDRWIRYGGYYPAWFLRLMRKGHGRYEEREMDEHIVLEKGRSERLQNDFVDHNLKGLDERMTRHIGYANREVRDIMAATRSELEGVAAGEKPGRVRWAKQNLYLKAPLFFRAFLYFFYRYFFRFGFLDGKEGLIYHFIQGCWYRFIVDAKFYEARRLADRTGRRAR